MLSYAMNGENLRPDHGFPLRCVVPGMIGGRSVKWLKKLIITAEPSDNWYHIFDNRVLPTTVSPDEASKDERWWKDERYAIYDLNVNSAIACPAHEERLSLKEESYEAKGYAYGGGGRRITRLELSLDKGRTWRLANIEYPEDRYRNFEDHQLYKSTIDMSWRDSCFCWCFWNLSIPTADLKDASDIVIRGMDEAMNVQPKDMYWSVLGMMNNPWFRVKIHQEEGGLRFEHPTQPALMPGGWMERVKKEGGDLMNGQWGERTGVEDDDVKVVKVDEVKMTKDGVDRLITIEELKEHEKGDRPWFVVGGHVFDGTAFLEDHPGGATSITSAAAQDATEEFMAIRKLPLSNSDFYTSMLIQSQTPKQLRQ
jgi:nitrate reductase (NAD(P)H)